MLAADLAGARVDINEASKALAYLRHAPDGEAFFAYLRAIVRDGRAVIRSGQTLGYYRDLLAACERHLRGMDIREMRQTLGWAIRLLRYYRAFPDAGIAPAPAAPTAAREQRPSASTTQPAAPAQPPAPALPAIGAIFTSRVMAADETAVLVEVPGFDDTAAIGVIPADLLGAKRYAAGNMARVEVTGVRQLKSGRTIVELKPAPRPR